MAILAAYALPHPPLAVPDVGRGQQDRIHKTLDAFEEAARGIEELAPETIVFITPHDVRYADYFHISPREKASGNLSHFGAPQVRFDVSYDTALAGEVERCAGDMGIPAGTVGQRDAMLDHGVMVPMWFINRHYTSYRAVRVSQSGMDPEQHYRMGQCLREAADRCGRRIVIVASSDLSHRLSEDGPYGYAPEGEIFDAAAVKALSTGDFLPLFEIPESLLEAAGECGYNSLMMMAGCFDCQDVDASLLSYEGPFGVGYAVARILPKGRDDSRDILAQYERESAMKTMEGQKGEDSYRALARQSLEHRVRTGGTLQLPGGLPDEMLNQRAGTFVSLHKNGRLRGCIGTIAPTTKCVAQEILQNAVSAGLHDSRFPPVSEAELPLLTYKVDVLSPPEEIEGPGELDVLRYGVIVSSGMKRGLLLPNLEGVDTVEQQIAIARQKGGISEGAQLRLERFEVIRHE